MNTNASCFIVFLSILTGAQADMEWVIYKKVSDFSQTLTLFCKLKECCKETAGWVKWVSGIDFDTLVLSVKDTSFDEDAKYDGRIGKNGFYLMIRNVSSKDFGANYSCTYGIYSSPKKLLTISDAFVVQTETRESMERTKENGGNKTLVVWLIILACVVMVVGSAFILTSFRLYKAKIGNRDLNTIDTSDNTNQSYDFGELMNGTEPFVPRSIQSSTSVTKNETGTQTEPKLNCSYQSSYSADQSTSYCDENIHQLNQDERHDTLCDDDYNQSVEKTMSQTIAPSPCNLEGYATSTDPTNTLHNVEFKSSSLPRRLSGAMLDNRGDSKNQNTNIPTDTLLKFIENDTNAISVDCLSAKRRKNTETPSYQGFIESRLESMQFDKDGSSYSSHLSSLI